MVYGGSTRIQPGRAKGNGLWGRDGRDESQRKVVLRGALIQYLPQQRGAIGVDQQRSWFVGHRFFAKGRGLWGITAAVGKPLRGVAALER